MKKIVGIALIFFCVGVSLMNYFGYLSPAQKETPKQPTVVVLRTSLDTVEFTLHCDDGTTVSWGTIDGRLTRAIQGPGQQGPSFESELGVQDPGAQSLDMSLKIDYAQDATIHKMGRCVRYSTSTPQLVPVSPRTDNGGGKKTTL